MATLISRSLDPTKPYQATIDRVKQAGLAFKNVVIHTEGGWIEYVYPTFKGSPLMKTSDYAGKAHPFCARLETILHAQDEADRIRQFVVIEVDAAVKQRTQPPFGPVLIDLGDVYLLEEIT